MEPEEDLLGELRDLLAVIHSSAALVGRRVGPEDVAYKHLDRIREHVRRATDLLGKLERP